MFRFMKRANHFKIYQCFRMAWGVIVELYAHSSHSQNAEATFAVSSTGSGPTPPRGISRTVEVCTFRCLLLFIEQFSTPLFAFGRRNARPDGKFEVALASAATSKVARKGRSFIILAMVFDSWILSRCHEQKSCLLVCPSPVS